MRVVVITGMSGGGKSTALRSLEDVGFFCVDNLPVPLLGRFVDLIAKAGEASRVAIVIDVRGGEFLAEYTAVFEEIREAGHQLEVVFLDASDELLVRRFSESRRQHPLGRDNLRAGLADERAMLAGLRAEARTVVDTSSINVHELRRRLRQKYAATDARLRVGLMSFGFKHGVPAEADLVFDVRFLPNPYFVEGLRLLTGIDSRVSGYVLKEEEAQAFLQRVADLLEFLLPRYQREGKAYLTVAIGCTGGQHRSVAVAEALRHKLGSVHPHIGVRHRDMERK